MSLALPLVDDQKAVGIPEVVLDRRNSGSAIPALDLDNESQSLWEMAFEAALRAVTMPPTRAGS